MFRLILPAMFLATAVESQVLGACKNIPFDQENCVRVLACIGDEGVFFDGQARGWNSGPLAGFLSDDTLCTGDWDSDGPLGTGLSSLSCENGVQANVIYYSQDGVTGTVFGRGQDNLGRQIKVWSGENVLQFLTNDFAYGPALPCIQGPIPLS